MGVQERQYMGRDNDPVLPGLEVQIEPPAQKTEQPTGKAAARLMAACKEIDKEVTALERVVAEKNAEIELLRHRLKEVVEAHLSKPEIEPIVRATTLMLCGLVYCRPVDEADRLKIVAAADAGHELLSSLTGVFVNFPAARLLWEEASRQFYDFKKATGGA